MEKETQNQEEHDTGTKKAKAPGEGSQKSGFWKGVLTGALVTAFAGLAVVGVASGINVIERSVNGIPHPLRAHRRRLRTVST